MTELEVFKKAFARIGLKIQEEASKDGIFLLVKTNHLTETEFCFNDDGSLEEIVSYTE